MIHLPDFKSCALDCILSCISGVFAVNVQTGNGRQGLTTITNREKLVNGRQYHEFQFLPLHPRASLNEVCMCGVGDHHVITWQ